MHDRTPPSASDVAWRQVPGAAPVNIDAVRCGSCGAHTPVLGTEPTCVYCAMPVELPSDVRGRASQVQRNIERAREEAAQLDRELASEGAGFVNGVIVVQVIGIIVSLAFWVDLLGRAEQRPTALQLMLVAGSFLGPLMFWLIAQHLRVSAEMRKLAKLSFARLEVQAHPTGVEMQLSCSGCGGAIDAGRIQGLTVRCMQCNNAMLAPARLVDAGQQHYLQQVLALRRRVEGKHSGQVISLCVIGLFYFATVCAVLVNMQSVTNPLTGWVVITFFYPFSLAMFYAFTHRYEGWELFWVGFAVAGFPLIPVMGQFFWYLQLVGVTQAPQFAH
jgi:hypothetical protein